MVDIQCAAADIRREKKEEDRRKKPQGENIMACPIPQGGHNHTSGNSNHALKWDLQMMVPQTVGHRI